MCSLRVDVPSYSLTFDTGGRVEVDGNCVGRAESRIIIRDRVISDAFASVLPSYLTDLLDVALAVYIADRASRRTPAGVNRNQFGWTRRLNLRIPVAAPEKWSGELYPHLIEALEYFTEDHWNIEFYDKGSRAPRGSEQYSLFPYEIDAPVRVALFSGGLDSLAGLCRDIVERPYGTIILFAGRTNARLGGRQGRLIEAVSHHLGGRGPKLIPCVVPFGFTRRRSRAGDRDEVTQRTRGFLYAMFGAVTAAMANVNSLSFYENGVGCINLPYTRAQFGTHLTRATHPLAMLRMSRLVSLALDRQFEFRLPNLELTKGELCRSLSVLGVPDLIGQTISCDGVPRVSTKAQCGLCTSCLLRRQSIYAAGLSDFDDAGEYIVDILSDIEGLPDHKLYPFRAMLHQVERLRSALSSDEPVNSLSATFPELLELTSKGSDSRSPSVFADEDLMHLYETYCLEWEAFPARPPAPRRNPIVQEGHAHA